MFGNATYVRAFTCGRFAGRPEAKYPDQPIDYRRRRQICSGEVPMMFDDSNSWIWPITLAPFIGSFLGVLVTRAEAPYSIVFGRSYCEACRGRLMARDMLPIVSWLAL